MAFAKYPGRFQALIYVGYVCGLLIYFLSATGIWNVVDDGAAVLLPFFTIVLLYYSIAYAAGVGYARERQVEGHVGPKRLIVARDKALSLVGRFRPRFEPVWKVRSGALLVFVTLILPITLPTGCDTANSERPRPPVTSLVRQRSDAVSCRRCARRPSSACRGIPACDRINPTRSQCGKLRVKSLALASAAICLMSPWMGMQYFHPL
jgi:hypothetical protein